MFFKLALCACNFDVTSDESKKFWDTVFSRGFQGRSPKRCNPELWGIIFSDKHVWMDIKIFSLVCSVSVVKHTCSWHDKLTVLCMDNIDKVRLFTMENVIIMYISIVIDIVSGEGSFKITWCFFFFFPPKHWVHTEQHINFDANIN